MSNPLSNFFDNKANHVIHKWIHYFDIYHRHFNHLRGHQNINILEIGVSHGGSLEMWNDYFGQNNVMIYGMDIDAKCMKMELKYPNMKIFIGDQSDPKFLNNLISKLPKLDIIIDDGGHQMDQQKISFDILYPHLKENGIYLCEDLHTSYWKEYNGGYKNSNTFIEYIKNYIDKLNAYHSQSHLLKIDTFTNTTNSIHFYDSVVVIEKKNKLPLQSIMKGTIHL